MKNNPQNVSSAKVRSAKIAEFLKKKGFDVKHGHVLEILSISQGFDSWNHYSAALNSESNTGLIHSVSEYGKSQNKEEDEQGLLAEIVKKEYPYAKIVRMENLDEFKAGKSKGRAKSVTAEQMIKKWSNPEYIRKMYGEKEKSNITSVVIEHPGRKETLLVDLETKQVIGVSG